MTISDPTITSATPPPRNWFQRNLKWVLPTGCLALIVVIALFMAGIAGIVFTSMKSTDAYKEAVAKAQAHPTVREALGEPIRPTWYLTGNVNVTGPSGWANLAIPLKGSRRNGTLYAVATKIAGTWKYQTLEVVVEGQDGRIDLLTAADLQ